MKQLKLLLLTSAICLTALFAFIFFRTVPVSRLWKGYQVLYVTGTAATEEQIFSILEQSGCKNVVSRANQKIPLVSSFSPVQVQSATSYLQTRNAFFSDETKSAMVFYIPEGQDIALSRAIRDITSFENMTAGTDGAASFPWISPIICIIFAAVCAYFAKNRLLYVPCAAFLVLFSFSRPVFTTAAATCLSLYGFFMLQKIWKRRDFLSGASSPLVVVCLLVPLLLLFVASPLNALFYTVAVLAAFSALLLVDAAKTLYDERYVQSRFMPVLIRSARAIPLVERKEVKMLVSLFAAVLAILIVSFAGSSLQRVSLDSSQPALPAPAMGAAVLPDLDDFMAWSWHTVTFPYRRLTDTEPQIPVDGDKISVPVFDAAGGKIAQSEQTVYVYNSAFRNSVYDSVKGLPYPALEKMLLRQGKDTRYSYAKSGGAVSERWGTALLLLFIFIPVGMILYFVVIKRNYGISL